MNDKLKKTLLSALSAAVLSLSATSAILANEGTERISLSQQQSIQAGTDQQQEVQSSKFRSVTGFIQEIADHGLDQQMQLITIETAEGDINHIVVSDETYQMDNLTVGSEIISFYDAEAPMILIYPPQYSAIVTALVKDGRSIKVDHFDKDYLSADGSLKLNISDETEIIQEDGTKYTGELADHNLIVSYGASTRSIPAQTTPDQIVVLADKDQSVIEEIDDAQLQPSYASISGTIQEIKEHDHEQSMRLITVGAEEDIFHLIVSEHTYLDDELAVGSEIIAFYNEHAPMLMIYPPQYNAVAIALANEDRTIMIDHFDNHLLNSDQSLVLKIDEATEILSQDGTVFEGELAGRKLFVEYDIVLESYPAQITPIRVIVLEDEEISEVSPLNEESILEDSLKNAEIIKDIANKKWIVNGEQITAPAAFVYNQDVVMVPLRAIAEALGYEVKWIANTKEIKLGHNVSLQVGQDSYLYAQTDPIELGAAPALVKGHTYVPLSFFKEVVRVDEVYIDDDGIVIREEA